MNDTLTWDETLLQWIQAQAAQLGRPMVLGISGAQGSGKSTLSKHLAKGLEQGGLRCAILSLDDLYKTRPERQALAQVVHPLLATRGVPGTHDVSLGLERIRTALNLKSGESMQMPRFDKASDDRLPMALWDTVKGPVDVLLFEGWCIGVTAQAPEALREPVNALEATEDADGRWRSWVNAQLADQYRGLFAYLDRLIYLQVPDWDAVLRWRTQQEKDTAQQSARAGPSAEGASQLMDATALQRFIQHYERISRHAFATLPARADVLRTLGPDHSVLSQSFRR